MIAAEGPGYAGSQYHIPDADWSRGVWPHDYREVSDLYVKTLFPWLSYDPFEELDHSNLLFFPKIRNSLKVRSFKSLNSARLSTQGACLLKD